MCVHTHSTHIPSMWIRTSLSQHALYKNKRGHFFCCPHSNKKQERSSVLPPPLLLLLFARFKWRNNMFTLHLQKEKEWEESWPGKQHKATKLSCFSFYCLLVFGIKIAPTRSWLKIETQILSGCSHTKIWYMVRDNLHINCSILYLKVKT